MSRQLIITIILLLPAWAAKAQVETTAYLMNSLPHYVNGNPAFTPKYKFSLGLPLLSSISFSYTNNGFSYNDLVKRENGRLIADLSTWAKNLPDRNYITTAFQTDLLRLGLRINPKIYVTLNSTAKGYGRMMLPKQLASLLVNGTSPYIGQTLVMKPDLQITSYLEHAAGLSLQLTDELTVGARVKVLHGMVGATTERSRFGLTLDEDYQITATGDFSLKSSGLDNFTNSNYSFSEERSNYFKNTGWGIDLGATYEIMDNLTVAASLIDIGRINWKNNLLQYGLSGASYTFTGIDVDQLIDGNSSYMEAQLDSLQREFKLQENEGGSFKTALPGKFLVSGSYDVSSSFTVGTLLYNEIYQGRFASGWSLMMNKNFGRVLSTSLSYTISNRSFNNLGAGVSFNFAPVQLYLVGDNLLRLPLSLAANQNMNLFINSTQVFNVRGGINLVWGWTKDGNQTGPNKRNANRKSRNSLKKADHIRVRQKK